MHMVISMGLIGGPPRTKIVTKRGLGMEKVSDEIIRPYPWQHKAYGLFL